MQAALGATANDACPAETVLLDLAQGAIEGAGFDALLAHLDGCAQCRQIVAELARDAAPEADAAAREPKAGDSIDRFLLLEELGRGGMGIVYAAFDPTLDRKVALKLVKPDPAQPAKAAAARLLSEAQALGRLSHPNVVTVFEAKAHGEQVYLAMELIQGKSLREFASQKPGTQALLMHFCEAGRGLQAAHDRGLVHRDFKPDNALLGDDGRVCVTDFGLAQSRAEPGARALRCAPAGTPGYLAPELWQGLVADARTDQFSFCVALWEALFGARPFPADKGPELLAQVRQAPVAKGRFPLRHGVSLRVRRALQKGLSFEPAERHASMGALLDELTAELRPDALSALKKPIFAAVALALIGAGATAHALWIESRATATRAAELHFAAHDDPLRAEAILASFAPPQSLPEPAPVARAAPEVLAPAPPIAAPAPGAPVAISSSARPRTRRPAPAPASPAVPLARMRREEARDAGPAPSFGGGGGGAGGSNSSSTHAPENDPLGARMLR
jgi:predicted Ser/Thr protein kinase